MNKKPKNIEQLFSESFEDFRLEPSSGLWKSISSKLPWKNFFTFNPTSLNAYYVAGLLTLATTGALLLTKPVTENNQEINEITINNERQKEEDSIKAKGKRQKAKVKNEEQESNKDIIPASSSEVLTKADNQKTDSCIKDRSPRTQNPAPSIREPVIRIVSRSEAKVDNTKLASSSVVSSTALSSVVVTKEDTQSPDPWLNIDSLFTNQTSTPPQHTIQFPNAFTPNSNGPTNGYYTPGIPNNDVFHPVYEGVTEYHLSIFNRRGELIFESNEINVGWDGYINDRLAAQGVYVWKAKGKYSNGENFMKFGNIMLIKK